MPITSEARAEHRRWLFDITQIPTAAGREHRVEAWITRWSAQRSDIVLSRDPAGNITLSLQGEPAGRPVYFTAHLDHPAFVLERVIHEHLVELSFRGGVMDDYFPGAKVRFFDSADRQATGTIVAKSTKTAAWDLWTCELDQPVPSLVPGDIARWDLPHAEEIEGCIHTDACDDLSAVAAALAAFDVLREHHRAGKLTQPVRVLFTRAEEVGFIGAIAAVRHKTMPLEARVIALENSRSFADSPIGGGPIVRVGDRISVFSPGLSGSIAKRAEQLGGPATPRAGEKLTPKSWKWQRKLMSGGACEASVFYDAGYDATCVCLALGNYHNMADLAAVQAGTNTSPPRIGREFVSLSDFDGLVDLLVACGEELPTASPVPALVEKLWAERAGVLDRQPR